MKKNILLILMVVWVASCAPKRARCYGKRCVDNSTLKERVVNEKQNS